MHDRTPPAIVPGLVTMVSVLYGSSGVVQPVIESAKASTHHPFEVLAIDNASSDAAESGKLARASGATFIQAAENHGYGGGVNAAVAGREQIGEFLLIANPDVVFEPGAIDALRAALADPTVAAAGPRILTADGDTYPSARNFPSLLDGVGHALLARVAPQNRWTRRYHAAGDYAVARDAGWLSGACLLVRTERFLEVDGFDERFFMYFEDVDLCDRLSRTGGRRRYVPEAIVRHSGAHSTSQRRADMVDEHHRSANLYLANTHRGVLNAPLRVMIRVGLAARSVVSRMFLDRGGRTRRDATAPTRKD